MKGVEDTEQTVASPALEVAHRLGIWLSRYPFKGRRALKAVVRAMLVPRTHGPVRIRARGGLEFIVNPATAIGIESALYSDGTYEEGTLSFMEGVLREGDTFLDVGAHIGLMSLVASRCVGNSGRVFALEPEPGNFGRLVRHIEINSAVRVTPLNVAMGDRRGSGVIFDGGGSNTGSATMMPPHSSGRIGTEVRVETIDGLCSSFKIERVRLLKIDVEGWELDVLRGASELLSGNQAPIVIIECSALHPLHGGERPDLYRILTSVNDYTVFKLARGKESPSRLVRVTSVRDLPSHDNLICLRAPHLI